VNTTVSVVNDALCVNVLRGLAIDAVERANSGHPGMPLGAAPMAYTLWSRHLKHNPKNPKWFDRDRFILSAGHGSMLLYGLLHLTGYDLSLDDLKNFRQWNSRTPGHPENHLTPGVEMATGPLGQGISTAVGMAIAETFLSAKYGAEVVDHHTFVICSDGDLMEGVAQEACALAGHLKLGKLICLYDDNQITIDGRTNLSFTEDTYSKFVALGWDVCKIDGMDVEAVDAAITAAKKVTDKPSMIMARTVIGFGSPNKADSQKSHGAPLGAEELALTKAALGLPAESFWVPAEVYDAYDATQKGNQSEAEWQSRFDAFVTANPELGAEFTNALSGNPISDWTQNFVNTDQPISTRNASGAVTQAICAAYPNLLGGCADLTHSVMTEIKGGGVYGPDSRSGRNINYGVREHAMAAAVNGITLHGGCKAFGGTFLIFSDYCRPSIRLAALMECPSIFVFSHDSIGLGEDGPTHQPVEQYMALRAIPNVNFMRPADAGETSACWQIALESTETPSILATSRQNLPILSPTQVTDHPALRGGYILVDAEEPDLILVATGSEVALAVESAKALGEEGIKARVVSLPSWFIFDLQDEDYQDAVLDPEIFTVSIEAGVTLGWQKYSDIQIGLDHFGASAPANILFKEFGFSVENIVETIKEFVEE
jgi:transketolase